MSGKISLFIPGDERGGEGGGVGRTKKKQKNDCDKLQRAETLRYQTRQSKRLATNPFMPFLKLLPHAETHTSYIWEVGKQIRGKVSRRSRGASDVGTDAKKTRRSSYRTISRSKTRGKNTKTKNEKRAQRWRKNLGKLALRHDC